MSKKEIVEVEEEKEIRGIRVSKDFVLYSDSMNLILEQYGIKVNPREKDLSKRESYGMVNKTFHRTLQQVFNQIIQNTTYGLDFGDLDGVNNKLIELENMIKGFKNITKLDRNTLRVIKGNSDSI